MNNRLKQIPNWDDYYASEDGDIYSYKFSTLKKLKKGLNRKTGYFYVGLIKTKNRAKTLAVHTLIAKSFLDPNYRNKGLVVDHIDDDKTNNKVSNLQLLSQRKNIVKQHRGRELSTGVCFCKNKYMAYFNYRGIKVHLGYFASDRIASQAYEFCLTLLDKNYSIPEFRKITQKHSDSLKNNQ